MRQPGRQELTEWGEAALQQLRGPVLTRVRQKLAEWRDPRARLIRQRRRAKGATATSAVATGTFGLGSFASLGLPAEGMTGTMMDMAGMGLGGLAVATGVGTIGLGLRYRRLKRVPLPEPSPGPVELPSSSSQAYEPMRRLRDAEQSLHQALAQLSNSGVGAPGDSVSDARMTADHAAAALRELAARLAAVEATIPHTPESERADLHADVKRLRAELDEGVEGYGRLVAAASRTVAASGAQGQRDLLQDATDRLAGLAAALQELSGTAWGRPGNSVSEASTTESAVLGESAQRPRRRDAEPN